MQNTTVTQTMDVVVAAIRAQVIAEMKAQEPTVTPQRRLLTCAEAALYLGRTEHAVQQALQAQRDLMTVQKPKRSTPIGPRGVDPPEISRAFH